MTDAPKLPPILEHPLGKAAKGVRRSLHVLTISPFYPNANDDSTGCFVAEPLIPLEALGVTTTVFAVQPFYRAKVHPRQGEITASWFRYLSLPGGIGLPTAGAFLFARIVSHVRALHRSHPIDLVHAHAPLPCGHAAMLLHLELGLPYVVSVHGLDAFSTNQVHGRAGEWCRRISQRVYQSSRRVICISEHVRERVLEGTGKSCRTSVVYNGVDPELFFPGEQETPDAPLVLSVGNLIAIKGLDVLIRSVASLSPEFPRIRLEIIGDGPERSALHTLASELNVADRVIFRGRQPRAEVAAAMRQCTIFALPSRYEALGCVYLEAMATGKPVIGCRGQGIAEIIRHGSNGFLVGTDNVRELTLGMAMLLRDQSMRASLGRAARDTVLEQLTLVQQTENLARIYRECAA